MKIEDEIKSLFEISKNATDIECARCLAAVEETRNKYKTHYDSHVVGWVCNDIKARIEAGK